ncbi:MAG: prepilin peptidase [Hyphomicrobiales bacterium]|nr:prepilin peptidase [Hyphomicrobiales bacterium]MDE2017507.1 prepilin peptidase [Hyphomicrobiales bacterium]
MPHLNQVLALFFPALMAFAASSDIFTMTISNRVSGALVAGYLVFAFATGVPAAEVASNFSCGLAVLAITFGMFAAGWIGGGDAKLAAATAVWTGWGFALAYATVASVLGGVLTYAVVIGRGSDLPPFVERWTWLRRLHSPTSGVPYGVALAAAGLLVYPETPIWRAIASFQ